MIAIMPIDDSKYFTAELLRLKFEQVPKKSVEEVKKELNHRIGRDISAVAML